MGQQPQEYDVIVIGSGIAGLTTAAILTILGRRVCVLEAHEVAGGGTHEYHVGGNRHYTFPSGLHYVIPHCEQILQIACMARIPPVRFPKLGIAGTGVYERLRLPRVSTEDLPIVHARQFMNELHRRYPALRNQLDRYEALALSVVKCFPLLCALHIVPWSIRKHLLNTIMPTIWWNYAGRTAEDVFAEIFADAPSDQRDQVQELEAYLCSLWVDTGCPPHRVSFFMIAAVGLGFPQEGGAYPRGGPQAMSMTLVQRIEATDGCHVYCRAPVHKILRNSTNDGAAIGVELVGGTKVMAKECIVSACGWRNTSRLLSCDGGGTVTGDSTAAAAASAFDNNFPPMEQLKVPQGEGFCMANIGLNGKDLNLECCNFWAQPAGRNRSIFDGVRKYLRTSPGCARDRNSRDDYLPIHEGSGLCH
jgi:all-trans-retinol 13,14-reductase